MDFYKISEAEASAILLQVCAPNQAAQEFWCKFKAGKDEKTEKEKEKTTKEKETTGKKKETAGKEKETSGKEKTGKEKTGKDKEKTEKEKKGGKMMETAGPPPTTTCAKPAPSAPASAAPASNAPPKKLTRAQWEMTLDSQPRPEHDTSEEEEDDDGTFNPDLQFGGELDGDSMSEDELDDLKAESTTSSDSPPPPPPAAATVPTGAVIDQLETQPETAPEPVLQPVHNPKDDLSTNAIKELEEEIKKAASPMKSKVGWWKHMGFHVSKPVMPSSMCVCTCATVQVICGC